MQTSIIKDFISRSSSKDREWMQRYLMASPKLQDLLCDPNIPVSLIDRILQHEQAFVRLDKIWPYLIDKPQFLRGWCDAVTTEKIELDRLESAVSKGQIDSKIWLCDVLLQIGINLRHVYVLCGWIGILGYLLLQNKQDFGIDRLRSFDIDPMCESIADRINRGSVVDQWTFKAATKDVNELDYKNDTISTTRLDGSAAEFGSWAHTVINTSCDHMGDDNRWFENIPDGTLVVLQNNNWVNNEQHNSCVHNLEDFSDRYPMSKLLYEGELDCAIYKRYMLVGVK